MSIHYIAAILLGLSGLSITLVGIQFSIKGLALWLPDPEYYIIIFIMAIAFEVAKLSTATFLFHYNKSKDFPIFFKIFLFIATLGLVIISSASIYVHLSKYASKEINVGHDNSLDISELEARNKSLHESKTKLDDQVNNLKSNIVNQRIALHDIYRKDKLKIDAEIKANELKIEGLKASIKENDNFSFMNGIVDLTGKTRLEIYTLFIIFIVALIDPLAISLIIASSYLFSNIHKFKETKNNHTIADTDEYNNYISYTTSSIDGLNEYRTKNDSNIESLSIKLDSLENHVNNSINVINSNIDIINNNLLVLKENLNEEIPDDSIQNIIIESVDNLNLTENFSVPKKKLFKYIKR
jgi:cell division protein FtsB